MSYVNGGTYFFLYPTNIALEPTQSYYAEIWTSTPQASNWLFTTPIYCTTNGAYFPVPLTDQFVNESQTLVYSFPHATSCEGYSLTTRTVSVDYYTTLPSFISVIYNSTDCEITFAPTTD